MGFSEVLTLIGGLCLFLFGMNVMGESLEKSAGSRLRGLIEKLTTNRLTGLLTGLFVTAVIQSSSATTVMVVGFVNSGVMTLKQAINVIMGANVGTTVTAWILSLAGVEGDNFFVSLFKPSTFTPVLALVGIILMMACKSAKKKDIGMILLGFATLMFGMETMSGAVSGLKDVPEFRHLLTAFDNPVLGVLTGAIVTAIIQSSSASVGILQALSSTGAVSVGATVPIILGQNIGTCVTAMLSSVGANKNARRAALVHLSFNVIGCTIWLSVFCAAKAFFELPILNEPANGATIAIVHTVFNIACTLCLLPMAGLLEKLAKKVIPDDRQKQEQAEPILDERLLATPAFAIQRCRAVSIEMAGCAVDGFKKSIASIGHYTVEAEEEIRFKEDETDNYEDLLGSYLVKLSARPMSVEDSNETTKILHMIGDFERISDHSVNIVCSSRELYEKELSFSEEAQKEIAVLTKAVGDIVSMTYTAYLNNDVRLAKKIEPLEQVIDDLKDQIRTKHITRLQTGNCSLDIGFVLSDLLTDLERVADHCSNIAGCIIEIRHDALDLHEYLDSLEKNEEFKKEFEKDAEEYLLP